MKKILVAYDGSEFSERAVEEAQKQAAQAEQAELHILSVVEVSGPSTNVLLQESFTTETAEKTQNQLQKLEESIEQNNLNIITKVLIAEDKDNPGEKVCSYAKENGMEMIVVGSRGLGNVKGLFLGSVSNNIIQHAEIPVLVVK